MPQEEWYLMNVIVKPVCHNRPTIEPSLILNEYTRRFVEKTVNITSGSSILIRQYYALIENFDVRFVEICLVFQIFLKTGWENLR